MSRTNILVVGIDAANPELLLRWSKEGYLPNIEKLLGMGRVASTRGIDGYFVGSTWPSLVTGVNPAGHGVHYLAQLVPGTYDFHRPHEETGYLAVPFWKVLTEAGKKVAILDVPLSRPDPDSAAVQVVEWGGHDSLFGFHASPGDLAQRIPAAFGPHPAPASCDGSHRTAEDYRRLIEQLAAGARTRASLTCEILDRGPFDLVMQVFTEAHCAGHQCWHLHDPRHPAHDPRYLELFGDPLLRVYQSIDDSLGIILDRHPGTVFLLVAHGMRHWYGGHFLLPEILFRLELAEPPNNGPRLGSVLGRWRRRVAAGLRKITGLVPRSSAGNAPIPGRLPSITADTRRSRCFVVPNGLAVGGIRFNLRGREPTGMVDPDEVPGLFRYLERSLREIVDVRTGKPVIRRVILTRDIYQGAALDSLPDVLVEWDDAIPTGSTLIGNGEHATVTVTSPAIGTITGTNHYGRSGEHRPGGLFLARGPGIVPGEEPRSPSLLDIAPTIAAALGVTLPNVDGRVQPEFLPG